MWLYGELTSFDKIGNSLTVEHCDQTDGNDVELFVVWLTVAEGGVHELTLTTSPASEGGDVEDDDKE
ncbi:unnamed protein product [Heterobilharzia americana]|nr:unnamed protein product [Heterobilharzia americana]